MTRFTKSVAMLLLALWVPVTMHCALETVPGFSFLQWCCGGDPVPQPDQECNQDSCSAVESGFYKVEDNQTFTPGLSVLLALAAWEWIADLPSDGDPHGCAVSSAPPDLPRVWQFSHRTALPPRAPCPLA